MTALEYSLFWDKEESFLAVLEYNPDLSIVYDQGLSILHKVIQEKNLNLVEALVEAGMDVNGADSLIGWTPLHYSVDKQSYPITEYLLLRGCEVNPVSKAGHTPLMLAKSYSGRIRDLLMANGAWDIPLDSENRTPLHEAAANSNISAMRRLLEEGKIIVDFQADGGVTPLFCALESGSDAAVRFLLEQGADINNLSPGISPLGAAIYFKRNIPLLAYMLDKSADPESEDSPLGVAVKTDNRAAASFLLERGAVVDSYILKSALEDASDTTISLVMDHTEWDSIEHVERSRALCIAIKNQNIPMIQELITRGALERDPEDHRRRNNPVTCAAQHTDSPEIMRILADAGADLSSTDQYGRDAMDYAEANDELLYEILIPYYP